MSRFALYSFAVRALGNCTVALLLTLAITVPVCGQTPSLELSYTLAFPQPHTHLYEVSFIIGNVTTAQLDLQMPSWTPGSYLMREFARNVQDFAARDESNQPLRWQKTDKATWRIETGAAAGKPKRLTASYRVYANELTVRTSHLDASHAYFNGASVFMYVRDQINQPLKLKINAPTGWRVTTPLALAPGSDGYYTAPNYDILVDSPTEVGTHNLLEFTTRGKTHRIAIWGEANYDEARLKQDFAKIVEQGAQIFGGVPYDHYTFILHIQPGLGGGLEHLNSTTCQATPRVFATRAGYVSFLGLIAHEYFHLWNVKRIRPRALGPFDYQNENYTRALWLSEGVTDYYGNQLLRRAGLMTTEEYLNEIARSIATYEATPGRRVQTAESASFDTWIKHYRPDENSVNTALSYYLRGDLLGLLLDIEIRTRTNGAKTLDDVMRLLNEKYALPRPGFSDAELKAAFEQVAGGDLTDFFNRYISGNQEIDFNQWFNKLGLQLTKGYAYSTPYAESRTDKPGTLGLRTRVQDGRIIVANVLAGLPAYESGINTNDELVAINGRRIEANNTGERGENLPAALNAVRAGQRITLTIFRRERLMNIELTAAVRSFDRYTIAESKEARDEQKTLRKAWLSAP
jgi:predicted metalloprotease with PDZ domain